MPRPRLTGLVLILFGKARAAGVVVALGERAIEELVEDDRIAHHLFGGGGVAIVKEIPAPQIDRVHADGGGDLVHVALDGKDGLRRAEAAEGAVGHRVGGPGARANAHVGADVRTGRVQRGARQDGRRERAVGAAVGGEVDVHGQQLAVGIERRCGGARGRDGAWWWRPGLPCGHRRS